MRRTLLAGIEDDEYCPVVITYRNGEYHFQTNGRFDIQPNEDEKKKILVDFEAYEENLQYLNDMDFTYEIIFPYIPTEKQIRLWIRLFGSEKESSFFKEIKKKLGEFEEKEV